MERLELYAPLLVQCVTRRRVAILLSFLVLFFGIAIFSPLHKHTPGKANSCSFNGIENQMVSLAEAAVVVIPVEFQFEPAPPVVIPAAAASAIRDSRDRAPPPVS